MIVIIRFWGWFGIAAIFWFPIMYVIFLLRCFLRGINKSKQMFKFCKDDHEFIEYAHSKLGIGLWLVWAIILSNAEEGTTAYAVCGAIYVICFVLSFLPFHRIFITKKS